ncbi:MAG: PAS domain S-box protein [Desulfobacterales bacterium]
MANQPAYGELAKQLAEQKDAIEKILKLNEIFSLLGENPKTNIEIIAQHAAKLLQGACCLYSRLDHEKQSLIAWASHNLPSDFIRKDTPDGHICYEVTMNEKDKPVVIGDIGRTIYHDTDPNVKKYGLKSYLGFPVSLGGSTIGALCIVDIKEREFSETEIHIISTLARAVSLEEERNQAKKKLQESEEKFRSIANTAMDSIFCKDINRHYTFVNSSMAQLMGCTEAELVGKVPEEVFSKEDAAVVNEVDQRALRGENVSEVRSLTISGKPYTFHSVQVPLRDADGNIKGISGIVRDITELKQAEEALSKTNERLEQQVKARTAELKERNIALKVLLDQRKDDKERLEKTIMVNIKKLINPSLARLKKSLINGRQKTELAILEANLDEIIAPFESSLSSEYLKLTPTEIQVANFIKHGATSQEIASSLRLSRRTIDTHRHNIRKKIGIRGKGVNLGTYLSSRT